MTTSNMVQARGDFWFVEMNHIFYHRRVGEKKKHRPDLRIFILEEI